VNGGILLDRKKNPKLAPEIDTKARLDRDRLTTTRARMKNVRIK
jgi:hypothetical protein